MRYIFTVELYSAIKKKINDEIVRDMDAAGQS